MCAELKAKSLFTPKKTAVLGIHASGVGAATGCYCFSWCMAGDPCHAEASGSRGASNGDFKPECDGNEDESKDETRKGPKGAFWSEYYYLNSMLFIM